MGKLDNKVVIITGASSGMGKAMAILFAREGAKVVGTGMNPDRLAALENEIKTVGGTITTLKSNIADAEDVERMIQTAVDTYGTLDILVNNAGIMDNFSPVSEVEDDVWERVMATNLEGPFHAMRSAVRIFMEKKSGVILNIASLGGITGAKAGAAYTASKHALVGLTKNTGYVYARHGIRCNAIAPGAVNTNIAESIDMTKVTPLVQGTIMNGMSIIPRTGEPDEIARTALWLVSDDASLVNGAVISVDGGWGAY